MSKIAKKRPGQFDRYSLARSAHGEVTLFSRRESDGAIRRQIWLRNLILYSGADVTAKAWVGQWTVNTMYLEFQQLANPGDTVPPPAFGRADGIAYYNGLSGSPNTDFLRVPLTVPPAFSASGADYDNNEVTLNALSEGTAGFFGKLFSDSVNSAVYGAALVAAPDPSDQSQDVVFSRVYSDIGTIPKEAGFQIGITWMLQAL